MKIIKLNKREENPGFDRASLREKKCNPVTSGLGSFPPSALSPFFLFAERKPSGKESKQIVKRKNR